MTQSLSAENYAALQVRNLVARDFIWFVVRDRDDGSPVTDGYWSGAGTITADIVDPNTGGTQSRQFFGAGGLIQFADIPRVSTLTVQRVGVSLSQVSDRINQLVREYDCKQGQVEIFRGLFDPVTREQVGPAYPRFVGFIDEAPIRTPAEGAAGDVVLSCTAHTQEMTRANAETRSDESQRRRSSTDNFFKDAAVVGGWTQWWGREGGPVRAQPSFAGVLREFQRIRG